MSFFCKDYYGRAFCIKNQEPSNTAWLFQSPKKYPLPTLLVVEGQSIILRIRWQSLGCILTRPCLNLREHIQSKLSITTALSIYWLLSPALIFTVTASLTCVILTNYYQFAPWSWKQCFQSVLLHCNLQHSWKSFTYQSFPFSVYLHKPF